LSMIVRVALDGPAAVGVNVTPILHFPPADSGASQSLLVTLNGLLAGLVPSITTVIPGFFLLPLGLLTVMFFGPLDDSSFTVPKFSDAGLIFSLTGTAVGVAVGVAVTVGVDVAVAVAVAVAVSVAVAVAVAVTVAVAVGVAVEVAVAV